MAEEYVQPEAAAPIGDTPIPPKLESFWVYNVVYGSEALPIPIYSRPMRNREVAEIGLREARAEGKTNPRMVRQRRSVWQDC